MTTINLTRTYEIVVCATYGCGIAFGLDADFAYNRRRDHKTFYCPNGHCNCWPQDNEVEQLRKKLERTESDVRWYSDQMSAARKDADLQRRKAAAAKGQVTRIRNRVANGICPAPGCKRSFTNVLEHIRTEHPDYHLHESS